MNKKIEKEAIIKSLSQSIHAKTKAKMAMVKAKKVIMKEACEAKKLAKLAARTK
jgi:hypothetical protein